MRKGEAMRETKKWGRTLELGQEKDSVFCWRAVISHPGFFRRGVVMTRVAPQPGCRIDWI